MDTSDSDSDAGEGEDVGESIPTASADDDSNPATPAVDAGDSDSASADGDSNPATATVDTDDSDDEGQEPTPQSVALRRQQRYVGAGGALVAGVALAVGTFQRFTDSLAVATLAGVAGTVLVLWLVRKSIFPGESAATE